MLIWLIWDHIIEWKKETQEQSNFSIYFVFHNEVWFSFLINTGNCNHWPFFHPLSDDQMIYILVVGESVQGLTIRGGSQVYQSVDKQFRLTRFSTSFHNINTTSSHSSSWEKIARNFAGKKFSKGVNISLEQQPSSNCSSSELFEWKTDYLKLFNHWNAQQLSVWECYCWEVW